jgi:hypothetical protein
MNPRWLVLTWRLPAASSTPRVATWRNLQRLGAVILTPGAVIVPYSEHLVEQLEWVAEDIAQRGGDAYVLPVTELPEADEEDIRRRMKRDTRLEYERLASEAEALARQAAGVGYERGLAALRRGLQRAVEKDHFRAGGRSRAERAIRMADRRKEA